MEKSPDAFRTISEVAEWLGTPTHVLRFWESRFTQVKPVKRAGGRRYYRPTDMELLGGIKKLLHSDGMTIRGVQKLLREEGARHVASLSPPIDRSMIVEGTVADSATEAPTAVEIPAETPEMKEPARDPVIEEAPIAIDVIPEPVENVVPLSPVTGQVTAPELDLTTEPAAELPVEPEPDPVVPPVADIPNTPKPIIADVPDDPGDGDAALAAISAAPQGATQAPSDRLSVLYQRLRTLQLRINSRAGAEPGD